MQEAEEQYVCKFCDAACHMQLDFDAKLCISKNTVQKPLAKASLALLARASYAVVLTDACPAALLNCLRWLLSRLCSQMLADARPAALLAPTASAVVLADGDGARQYSSDRRSA